MHSTNRISRDFPKQLHWSSIEINLIFFQKIETQVLLHKDLISLCILTFDLYFRVHSCVSLYTKFELLFIHIHLVSTYMTSDIFSPFLTFRSLLRVNINNTSLTKGAYVLCTTYFVSINPNATDSESLKPLSVLHSGLKRKWWPIENS